MIHLVVEGAHVMTVMTPPDHSMTQLGYSFQRIVYALLWNLGWVRGLPPAFPRLQTFSFI